MRLGILFYLCLAFNSCLEGLVVPAPTLEPFTEACATADTDTLVIFDINNTLIVPEDRVVRSFKNILLQACEEASEQYNKEYLHSKILLRMRFCLVDPNSIPLIQSLQQRNIKTIGCTALRVGPYGMVSSLEDWRIESLQQLHVSFSSVSEKKYLKIGVERSFVLFKHGVLFANGLTKGKALTAFLKTIGWRPQRILFLDASLNNLEAVERACSDAGIAYTGFHYTAVENAEADSETIDAQQAAVWQFQIAYLLDKGVWLSEKEAMGIIEQSQSS